MRGKNIMVDLKVVGYFGCQTAARLITRLVNSEQYSNEANPYLAGAPRLDYKLLLVSPHRGAFEARPLESIQST